MSLFSVLDLRDVAAFDTAVSVNTSSADLTIDCPANGVIIAAAHWSTGGTRPVRHTSAMDLLAESAVNRAVSAVLGNSSVTWGNLTERYTD